MTQPSEQAVEAAMACKDYDGGQVRVGGMPTIEQMRSLVRNKLRAAYAIDIPQPAAVRAAALEEAAQLLERRAKTKWADGNMAAASEDEQCAMVIRREVGEAERSGTQEEERASEARTLGDAPENRPESAGVAQKGATGVSPRIEAPASPAQTPPSEGVREALELLQRAKERIIKHVAGWPGVHDPTLLQDIDDFTRAALAAPSREGLGEPDRPPPFGI